MINPAQELRDFLTATFVSKVPHEHPETPEQLVQRRWISAVTLAVGSFVMAWTIRMIRVDPGDPTLYAAGLALATTWVVGSVLSGKLYVGSAMARNGSTPTRGIVQALALGVLLVLVFLAGGAVVAAIPVLREPLVGLLSAADQLGSLPVLIGLLCLNAMAEELFFRGSLYEAAGGQHEVLITTFVYALSMVPSGIPVLIFGSAALGTVVGLQRRVTGGVLGPIITHLTWLAGMLLFMPGVLNLWQ